MRKDEIETPLYVRKYDSLSLLRRSVDKKADQGWVEATIGPLKEDITEVKAIALKARERDMKSLSEDPTIKEITKTMNGWKNIQLAGVVSGVVLVIGIAGQYFALKNSVGNNQQSIAEVQDEVSQVSGNITQTRIEVQEIKTLVEEDRKQNKKQEVKQLEEIKSVIQSAFDEQSPKRRR